MNRCKWVNEKNDLYIKYHDEEWGQPNFNDAYLFELLLLEIFQAGLSWEKVLNKRENFRKAFSGFSYQEIANYDTKKVEELLNNKDIIRNRLKIMAIINNAKIFMELQKEYKSFSNYIWHFTNNLPIEYPVATTSPLSDEITKDLKKRKMKFIGSTIIHSYLQAIGVINSHEKDCFMFKRASK